MSVIRWEIFTALREIQLINCYFKNPFLSGFTKVGGVFLNLYTTEAPMTFLFFLAAYH